MRKTIMFFVACCAVGGLILTTAVPAVAAPQAICVPWQPSAILILALNSSCERCIGSIFEQVRNDTPSE